MGLTEEHHPVEAFVFNGSDKPFRVQHEHPSQWAAIRSVAEKLGCTWKRCGDGCARPNATKAGRRARPRVGGHHASRWGGRIGVAHGQILAATVAMMDQIAELVARALIDRLVQSVEDEVRAERRRHAPTDDAPCEDVNHKGDVDEPAPRRDIRKIRDPELIRTRGRELPIHQVRPANRDRVGR